MRNLYKKEDNVNLLLQSERLCRVIEPYIDILGLDRNEVSNFTEEINATVYITENFKSFGNSFFLFNMGTIRLSMELLIRKCEESLNYTAEIADALGIEKDANYGTTSFADFTFYLNDLN